MTTRRAILVSREQRDAIYLGTNEQCDAAAIELAKAFDAAGDQPRIRYCVPHARVASNASGTLCPKTSGTNPCRVVDAVVCVVES